MGRRIRVELKFIIGRFDVLTVLLASQGFLFLWIRAGVAASGWSVATRRRVIAAIGLAFVLFWALTVLAIRAGRALAPAMASRVPRLARLAVPLPMDPGRRRLLKAAVGGVAVAPVALSGYGAAYASMACEAEEVDLPFGCPLRVAQLTDIHAGLYMTRREMRRYADQVNQLNPDLFVLAGGFVTDWRRCRARGSRRSRLRIGSSRRSAGDSRWPASTDLRTGRPDLVAALRGLDGGIPTLLLSHRPEIFPEAAAHGVPLTLAGHWHGGQIKMILPGMDLSIAHLASPYPEGLFRIGGSHLYVRRGIGTSGAPIRLNAPAEITLFRLS